MTSTRREPVSISRALGMVVVTVHGAIDAQMSEQLRHLLLDLIDNQGNLDVVIDLRHVDVIDLTGIEVVVDASERMRCKGGRLLLSEPRSVVSASLEAAHVTIARAQPTTPLSQTNTNGPQLVTFGPRRYRPCAVEW